MKKVLRIVVPVLSALFFAGCASTSSDSEVSEDLTVFESELENMEGLEEGELLPDETVYTSENMDLLTWREIRTLDELTGIWNSEKGTYTYPFELDGKEYLKFQYAPTRDDYWWLKSASQQGIPLKQLWEKRFAAMSEIYNQELPSSDENGIQYGLKFKSDFSNGFNPIIISQREILIPEKILDKNLSFFMISEDNNYLCESGTFRYYSDRFQNRKAERVLYTKSETAAAFDTEPETVAAIPLIEDTEYFLTMQEKNLFQKTTSEYGLVLSGGGGKGAYEVGVWKALDEFGLKDKITSISGTSVGGLNAALFACSSLEEIEKIWLTKVPGKLTQNDALISQEGLDEIIKTIPLAKINSNKFPEVTVTAVRNRFLLAKFFGSKPGQYASRFTLNIEKNLAEIRRKLLATSAFPVICSPVKLSDGFEYSDGGNEGAGGDNTPIDPIVDNHPEIKKIIIVYLQQQPKRKIKEIDYDSKELIHIIPSIDLGGILAGTANFNAQRISLLMKTGYDDTVKILKENNLYPLSKYWFAEK